MAAAAAGAPPKRREQSQEEKPINSIQQKNEIMNAVLLGGSQLMELIY